MRTFVDWLMSEMPMKINLVGDWEGARKRVKSGDEEDTEGGRLIINPKGEESFIARRRRGAGLNTKAPPVDKILKGINRYPSSTVLQLTSDSGRSKIIKKFEDVPEDFVANFVIDPRVKDWKHKLTDAGEVKESWLREKGFNEKELPVYPDKINLVFMRNDGGDAIDMTAWIIAHRFGHMLAYGDQGSGGDWNKKMQAELNKFNKEVTRNFLHILKQCYGVSDRISEFSTECLFFANSVMSMKSARDTRIQNDSDIAPELLAQYIFKRTIFFRDMPPYVKSENPKKYQQYEDPDYYINLPNKCASTHYLNDLAKKEWNPWLQRILDSAKGKIFVM